MIPALPEPAADEAGAKAGKRPGSAKPRVSVPGGPGISKDAGESHAPPSEAHKATIHTIMGPVMLKAGFISASPKTMHRWFMRMMVSCLPREAFWLLQDWRQLI